MITAKINNDEINTYVNKEYDAINAEYNQRLNATPSNKYMNNLKNKDINNIILTKDQLIKKGYALNFIEKYINNEYNKLDNKYINNVVDFID